LFAFLFLLAANYNFIHQASETLKTTKDNYGQALISQISTAIDQEISLLSNVFPALIDTYFPEGIAEAGVGSNASFDQKAERILLSLKAINNQVDSLIFISDANVRACGEIQTFYGVTSKDVSAHWALSCDTEITLILPMSQTYSQNSKLLSLCYSPVIVLSIPTATSEPIYCILVLKENYFNTFSNNGSDIAIVDKNQHILHNTTAFSEDKVVKILSSNENSIGNITYITNTCLSNQLTLVHAYDTKALKTELNDISGKVLLLDSILIVLSVFLAHIYTKRITLPFRVAVSSISSYPSKTNNVENKIRKLSKMSLREQMYGCFLVLILPAFLVFCLSSFFFYKSITTKNYKNTIHSSFLQTHDEIQQMFDNTSSVAKAITLERNVQDLSLESDTNWRPANFQFFEKRVNIGLYDQSGSARYLSDAYSFSEKQLSKEEMVSVQGWSVCTNSSIDYLQFIIPFRSVADLELRGYLLSKVEPSDLIEVYVNLYESSGEAFLVDSEGTIVSHRQKNIQQSITKEERVAQISDMNDLVFEKQIRDTPFSLVLCGNLTYLHENQRAFILNTLYLCLGVLVIVLLLSSLLAHFLSQYFEKACRSFLEYTPNMSSMFNHEPSLIDEVNQINNAFTEMTVRIERMQKEAIIGAQQKLQLELDARRGELALLQAQINPHFLSNTFENINYFIRNNEPDKAIKTLNTLSDMFSYAVREKRKTVPLADELNYVKRYIEIMQIRFPGTFTLQYDVPEKYLSYNIPCFCLQPIVENAITHGLLPKETGGLLHISCMGTGDRIYLMVKDNGIGIEKAELQRLEKQLQEKTKSSSIGLYNTHYVLHQLFGDPFGLKISSQKNVGTTVIITLPSNTP